MINFEASTVVIKKSAPGVQSLNTEHADWAELSHFLVLAEAGSLREAARRSHVSVNTVRARLSRLESRHGGPLAIRGLDGVTLTARGDRLYQVALEMRRARIGQSDVGGHEDVLLNPGRLTIACTEGLGISWLTPRIPELKRRLPQTTLELQFDYDLKRDRSNTADVGLTFLPPASPDLIISKMATLHFMLFASPAYLRDHGIPTSIDELRQHMLVEQVTSGYSSAAYDLVLGADRSRSKIAVQTNSVMTQLWAAASGAGIAALPSYTRAVTSLVVPLPVIPQMRFPVSCFYHAEARNSPAVRTALDWLREAFDPDRFPWFRDDFVHPDDFPGADTQGDVIELYAHMADRIASVSARPESSEGPSLR